MSVGIEDSSVTGQQRSYDEIIVINSGSVGVSGCLADIICHHTMPRGRDEDNIYQ